MVKLKLDVAELIVTSFESESAPAAVTQVAPTLPEITCWVRCPRP
ncbi:MAG TPA: hypothetical protein VM890_03890 [Longimicrobium sp.]|nr:hypothetical protein [Longimicrobium sp.]